MLVTCCSLSLPMPQVAAASTEGSSNRRAYNGNEQGAGLPKALTGIHSESDSEKLSRIRRNMGLEEVLVFTWLWRYQEMVEEIPVFFFLFL